MMKGNLKESEITKTIVKGFMDDLLDYAKSDVIIVGAGPCGTTAAIILAREGVKTLLIEKDVKAGGGMWQGGMLFSKMVVEGSANRFLESLGIKMEKDGKFYTADSYYVSSKLLSLAFEQGAKMLNSVKVQDVIYRDDGIKGVVINWNHVANLTASCVDPLSLESKVVIDATGHSAEVVKIVSEKIGLKDKFVGREGSMWVDRAELATVENTKEIYSNLIVAGMAANGVAGLPRMGPIFGGMFLSGIKAAKLALMKIKGVELSKNNINGKIKDMIY